MYMQTLENLKLVGINTRTIWKSSGHQYSDNYIKFSCSKLEEKKIVKELKLKLGPMEGVEQIDDDLGACKLVRIIQLKLVKINDVIT